MKKLTKITGVVLTTVLALSMLATALPVSAAPGENAWDEIGMPDFVPGSDVTVMAVDADGSIIAAIKDDDTSTWDIVKSTDMGYTWDDYVLSDLEYGVKDIEISTDGTVYVACGCEGVWRIADGQATLLKAIVDSDGALLSQSSPYARIHSIDVWNDGTNNWILAATDLDVFVMEDKLFGTWIDMEIASGGDWAYAFYAEFAPDFATSEIIWALVSSDNSDTGDFVLTSTVSPGQWGMVLEPTTFENQGGDIVDLYYWYESVDIAFADNYDSDTNPLLYVALTGEDYTGNLFLVQADEAGGTSVAYPLLPDDVDVGSVEVSGDTILVAERWDADAILWRSTDAGDTFTAVTAYQKPIGSYMQVHMAPDFTDDDGVVYVGTRGSSLQGSAFSISIDGGVTYNAISWIDLEIDDIIDIAFDGDTTYMATEFEFGGSPSDIYGIWTTDNATAIDPVWELAWAKMIDFPVCLFPEMIEVALDGSAIFMFAYNDTDSDYEIWKAADDKLNFSHWRDLPGSMTTINDWVIESSTTMYAATDNGFWGTGSFGPATLSLAGDDLNSIDIFGETIAVGYVGNGEVAVSIDAGETWGAAEDVGTGDVFVAFGPTGTLYAATSDSQVLVFDLDDDDATTWEALEDSNTDTADATSFSGLWVSPDDVVYAIGGTGSVLGDTTYSDPTVGGTIDVQADHVVANPEVTGSADFDYDTVTLNGTFTVTDDDVVTSIGFAAYPVTVTTPGFIDGEAITYSGSLTYTLGTDTMAGPLTVTGSVSGAIGTFSPSFTPNPGIYTDTGSYPITPWGATTVSSTATTNALGLVLVMGMPLSMPVSGVAVSSGVWQPGDFVLFDPAFPPDVLTYNAGANTFDGTLHVRNQTITAHGVVAVSLPWLGAPLPPGLPAVATIVNPAQVTTTYVSIDTPGAGLSVTDDVFVETITVPTLHNVGGIVGTFADSEPVAVTGSLTYNLAGTTLDGTLSVTAGGSGAVGTTANMAIGTLTGMYTDATAYPVTDTGTAVAVHVDSFSDTITLSSYLLTVTSGYFSFGETVTIDGNVTTDLDVNAGTFNVTGATGTATVDYPLQALPYFSVNNDTYPALGSATVGGALATATSLVVPEGTSMTVTGGEFTDDGVSLDVDASILVATSSTILEGTIYVSDGLDTAEFEVTIYDSGFVMDQPYTITGSDLTVSVDDTTPPPTDPKTDLFRLLIGEVDNVWETAQNDGAMGLWGTQGSNILWTLVDIDGGSGCEELWALEDTVSGPVMLVSPSSSFTVAGTTSATLTWEELADGALYEVGGDFSEMDIDALELDVTGLTDNTEYDWKVRVEAGEPFQSRWSGTWTFTTTDAVAPPIPAPRLVPANGAYNVPVEGPAFAWDPDGDADGFIWELSADPLFGTLIAEADLAVPYIVYDGTLDFNTAYYWRVNAYSDVGGVSTWVVSVFTTETPAADPVVVEENPPTVVTLTIPEDETPSYIWAIIAIGLVLAISIIILTVRTRRIV